MKRAFIIHGWDGLPEDGWFPWLADKLEAHDFEVRLPVMPHTSAPKIEEWVPHLEKAVGKPDEETYFVGHSIGCQAILRYLERLPKGARAGGVVCVAGWLKLQNLETEEEKKVAEPWLTTPINFKKVLTHTKNFIAIFSDNDHFVSADQKTAFEKALGARTRVLKGRGHFTGIEGNITLPAALEAILEIAGG